MKKQYFNPERDGFYGVYYPNSTPSSKAMIARLGDSSDDRMVQPALSCPGCLYSGKWWVAE